MWVLISRRLRLWALATIALPILGWALGKAGQGLEQRRGQTRTSHVMLRTSDRLRRNKRR